MQSRYDRARLSFCAYLDKERDNSNLIIEENGNTQFYNRLVRHLESHHNTYNKGLDQFVLNLQNSSDAEYAVWFHTLKKVYYNFMLENMDRVNEITTDINNCTRLLELNQMYNMKQGTINRVFPITVNVAAIRAKGYSIIDEIEEIIKDVENNNSDLVIKINNRLDELYNDLDDPYLIGYYNELKERVPSDLIRFAKMQIDKVKILIGEATYASLNGYVSQTSFEKQKAKNTKTYVGANI